MEISEAETARFEGFLDRNFPDWRKRNARKEHDISRDWLVGVDDIIRHAIYRKEFVEVYDDFIELDESQEAVVHFMKNILCDIDGDLTPVAVWES